MAIKIPMELKRIVETNQQIIHSLKVQKARQDQMLDKYESQLKEELDIPSNRFLPIYKNIVPFLDNVINSKLIDYEILKRNEAFIKALIQYNAEFVIMEEQVNDLEDTFDVLVNNILELEQKCSEYTKINSYLNKEISDLKKNKALGHDSENDKESYSCSSCERILDDEKEIESGVCNECSNDEKETQKKEKEPESEIVPEIDEELEDDHEEKDDQSLDDDESEVDETKEEEEPPKPNVRKGFASLMKDFDKKYRKDLEEAEAKEREKIDHLDAI